MFCQKLEVFVRIEHNTSTDCGRMDERCVVLSLLPPHVTQKKDYAQWLGHGSFLRFPEKGIATTRIIGDYGVEALGLHQSRL